MATPATPPAPLQTGKGRASRIPLDYFKSLNGLEKTKLVVTAVAVLAAGAWLAWGAFAPGGGGSMRYSHGPVSLAHADIETNCEACHKPFSPISEQNLFMKHPSEADGKCLDCHSKADHLKQMTRDWVVHHSNVKPESDRSCAGCHREHQGRDFSLVRLQDNDCTSCHKDLKEHVKAGLQVTFANTVKDFATHPDFKGVKNEETLKFNHKLHLTAGQGLGYTLGMIKREDPDAYRRYLPLQKDASDSALVQLDCASCHVPQTGGHGATSAAGRYMQPISYDTHCKTCHPLTFDDRVRESYPGGKLVALAHGKPLAESRSLIEFAYTTAIRKNPEAFRGWKGPADLLPLPGKAPGEMRPDDPTRLATQATNYLRGKAGCGECHTISADAIEKVYIPRVWFDHAKFSHAAHGTSTMKKATAKEACLACHTAAESSSVNTDLLLPDAKSCRSCHGPARSEGGQQVGGVRSECTTCHTYHHGPDAVYWR
jgi:predicted CXXCH cytochrome family protein